jgi:hypothetical protein
MYNTYSSSPSIISHTFYLFKSSPHKHPSFYFLDFMPRFFESEPNVYKPPPPMVQAQFFFTGKVSRKTEDRYFLHRSQLKFMYTPRETQQQ